VWTCERTLPLATPVDESMTQSEIRQSGFTLRQANRDKPTRSSHVRESGDHGQGPDLTDFRQQTTRIRANRAAKLDLMRRDQIREDNP
jgi:hypothetical protein